MQQQTYKMKVRPEQKIFYKEIGKEKERKRKY